MSNPPSMCDVSSPGEQLMNRVNENALSVLAEMSTTSINIRFNAVKVREAFKNCQPFHKITNQLHFQDQKENT